MQRTYHYDSFGRRLTQIKKDTDGTVPQVAEDSYYGYNPHTDVETHTKENGDTRATYGYTAYGKDDTEAFTGIDKPDVQQPGKEPYNFYRFNGKRWDVASGAYDMGFRDYNPGLNRFLTRDSYNGALADMSLGTDPFTGNRYVFTCGNPITGVEIDGHGFCADEQCQYVCPGECSTKDAYALSDQMAADNQAHAQYQQAQLDAAVGQVFEDCVAMRSSCPVEARANQFCDQFCGTFDPGDHLADCETALSCLGQGGKEALGFAYELTPVADAQNCYGGDTEACAWLAHPSYHSDASASWP